MTTNPKDLVVTCVENGLFVDFCLSIAPHFKKFYYWTPWQNGFPKSNQLLPGDGFDEMQRVRNLWDVIPKSDLIFFPDCYWGDLQEQLAADGKLVWGSRKGEVLELDRMKSKKMLREMGVVPSDATAVRGLAALREHLKEHPNVHVKVSTVRGDFESFHSDTYELSEPKLDELEHKLGAKKLIAEFVVEPDISPAVEWGIDAYTIDGQWPARTFSGWERKDVSFLGRMMEWDEIPEYLRQPNEALSPYFKKVQYRGFFSTELRIKEDRSTYLIDPCARLPSPPNEIHQEIISNWPQIIAAGAAGQMVDPEPVAKYGVCAMIHSSFADTNWQSISFPEEIRRFVKLRNHCKIEGVDYVVPQEVSLPEVGAVIGLGNTIEEAIEQVKQHADQVKGYFLEHKISDIDEAVKEVEKSAELGLTL